MHEQFVLALCYRPNPTIIYSCILLPFVLITHCYICPKYQLALSLLSCLPPPTFPPTMDEDATPNHVNRTAIPDKDAASDRAVH